MDTKTEYMVARQLEDGTIIPLHWTAAHDDNALEGIGFITAEFNSDEDIVAKQQRRPRTSKFVTLKAITSYEVIDNTAKV